jgi:hypothetical protein
MLRLYVDFNLREDTAVIIIRLTGRNAHVREEELSAGQRVTLYDEGDEYEAVLRRGRSTKWVAEILWETHRALREITTPQEWEAYRREQGHRSGSSESRPRGAG